MVKQFAPIFDTRDLVNISNAHTVLRLMMGGLPSQPFTMANLPPLGNVNTELGTAIKQLSAAKFGTTRSLVEAAIFERLQGKPAEPVAAPAPVIAPVAPQPVPVEGRDPNGLSLGDITGGVAPAPAPTLAPTPPLQTEPTVIVMPDAPAPSTPPTPTSLDSVMLVPEVPLVPPVLPDVQLTPEPPVPVPEPVATPVQPQVEPIDTLNDGEASVEAQHEINELLHIAEMPSAAIIPKPFVGRPNHTVKHVTGRPIPAQVVASHEEHHEIVIEPTADLDRMPDDVAEELAAESQPAIAQPTLVQPAVVMPESPAEPEPPAEPVRVVDAAEYTSTAQNSIDNLMKTELIKPEHESTAVEPNPVENASAEIPPVINGPVIPHLEPGEIYVDELGTVHQG